MDAHAAQIVDLVWAAPDAPVEIDAHVAQVASYKADGDLALAAAKAYAVLDKMRGPARTSLHAIDAKSARRRRA